MRRSLAAGLICLFGASLPAVPTYALQFEQVPISAVEVIIGGRGPIVKGDTARLEQALAAVPSMLQLAALALDSPGGNVVEGELLARLIRTRRLSVVIPPNSKCVSACFLLLAASPQRLAAADALVGVHSASESGEETVASLAVTTLMAQDAAALGIPAAIIGKLVQTTPGRVEWLTHADLISMNVAVFEDDLLTALRQAGSPAARQATPAPPAPAAPQSGPPRAYTAGREDRRAWDSWLTGLRGQYRDGAAYALAQIGLEQPGSCSPSNGINRADFTPGCEAARQRLAPIDLRIHGNPDYAAGWNSAGPVSPAGEAVEAEYQGAFFCGRQVARLTLKVFPQSGEARRTALVSFGPQPTSPDVPHGAFMVNGAIELHGGTLTMKPVKWLSQPAGYDWLGLSGRSEDGGKTFSGRVINKSACTIFTLKRVDDATAAR